jgi:hypothetical protein
MSKRIKDNDMVMLDPMAPYRAMMMPNHPKGGGPRDGTTTGYCKHPDTEGAWRDFDYRTLSILGIPMTKQQMVEKFTKFVEDYRNFGSRGGTRSDVSAKLAFNSLYKEGLILAL